MVTVTWLGGLATLAPNQGLPRWLRVKNPPAMLEMQETWVQSLDWETPLEGSMATHSRILAWRIPRTEMGYSP